MTYDKTSRGLRLGAWHLQNTAFISSKTEKVPTGLFFGSCSWAFQWAPPRRARGFVNSDPAGIPGEAAWFLWRRENPLWGAPMTLQWKGRRAFSKEGRVWSQWMNITQTTEAIKFVVFLCRSFLSRENSFFKENTSLQAERKKVLPAPFSIDFFWNVFTL